ncbi:hypothetical protein R3W88_032971 [Solanum pinnatisectum]|uniref:Uncharacterized protein n=1 Tax=Solanum pinnatisectum TaxID=50273 RepID=A0AAV9K4A9_9SOLN|nr:hypothetical protein R3W88_032971 [Solanum pinnatisectum]
MEQGSEKQGVQVVDVATERSNDQSKELTTITLIIVVQTPPLVSSSTAIAPPSLLPYTNNFHNKNLEFPVNETCYEAGDNMMNYSIGNKTIALIDLNDVPHNVGEGFLQPPTSRQTITKTTTVRPHTSSSPVKGVKLSKAWQVSGDDRASQVRISRKEYGYQQASKCCSSSATSLPQGAASWLVLATLINTTSDESII